VVTPRVQIPNGFSNILLPEKQHSANRHRSAAQTAARIDDAMHPEERIAWWIAKTTRGALLYLMAASSAGSSTSSTTYSTTVPSERDHPISDGTRGSFRFAAGPIGAGGSFRFAAIAMDGLNSNLSI